MISAAETLENGLTFPRGHRLAIGVVTVFVASFVVLYFIQFAASPLISGESYYHARVAQLVREQGPLHELPSMAFGLLGERFSDKDFLFHWLRSLVADDVATTKVFTVVYGALIFAAAYFVLARHRVPFPGYWILLLLGSGYFFLSRLAEFRPQLLQILFFVLALEFLIARRHKRLFVLSTLYALSHSTSVGIVALALLWTLVDYVANRRREIRAVAYSAAGIALGFLLHPNFPANIQVWYVTIVVTLTHALGLSGAPDLNQGAEFLPVDGRLLVRHALAPTVMLVVSLALAVHQRTRWRCESLFLWIVALASFAGFLLSRRLIELWVPAQLLATAFLMRDWMAHQRAQPRWNRTRAARTVIASAVLAVTLYHDVTVFREMRRAMVALSASYFGVTFSGVGQWIEENVPEQDLVYNADWTAYAYLFYYTPRHRYIFGLDPVFLYVMDPALEELYQRISEGAEPDSVTQIEERFRSRWIVVQWALRSLSRQIQRDPRAMLRFQGDGVSLYEILPRSSFEVLKRRADQALSLESYPEAARLYGLLRRSDPRRFELEIPEETVALVEGRIRSRKPLRLLGKGERFEGWVLERGRYRGDAEPGFVVEERMEDGQRIATAMSAYDSASVASGKEQFRLTSPPFTIPGSRMAFTVRGGSDLSLLRVSLMVDGREVLWTTGPGSLDPSPRVWDLSPWKGKTAVLVVASYLSGSFLTAADVRFYD